MKLDYSTPPRPVPPYRLYHILIVVTCGFASAALMWYTAESLGPISTGVIFVDGMIPILGMLFLAVFIAVRKYNSTLKFRVFLATICLLPAISIYAITAASVTHYWATIAPSEKFRHFLKDPIPASVTNLRVGTPEEKIDSVFVLRFNISKADLDEIIATNGYSKIPAGKLHNPNDRFNDPNYLRVGSEDEFYQCSDGMQNYNTLRVNKEHTAAVFRFEGH